MSEKASTYIRPDARYPQKPNEDHTETAENAICVADGITRDPIGIRDFRGYKKQELLEYYPDPSPAKQAAEAAASSFIAKTIDSRDVLDALKAANQAVESLNPKRECDYLENDYPGCVLAGGILEPEVFRWASIGDCFVAVYDSSGKQKFISPSGTQAWVDFEREHNLGDFNLPEYRVLVRSHYRNNPEEPASYGALTGEAEAEHYFMYGTIEVESGDVIVCFSDGFENLAHESEFGWKLRDMSDFAHWDQMKAEQDYRYGHERSLAAIWVG